MVMLLYISLRAMDPTKPNIAAMLPLDPKLRSRDLKCFPNSRKMLRGQQQPSQVPLKCSS